MPKRKRNTPEIVSFDSSTNDGYNIRKNKLRWETFTSESWKEYNCIGFPSESDAMQHMLDELVDIYARGILNHKKGLVILLTSAAVLQSLN